MNYKLAKQLKEAGFNQAFRSRYINKKGEEFIGTGGGLWLTKDYERILTAVPTLSELIEACGDGFSSLTNCYEDGFRAYGKTHPKLYIRGKTPEEAVAKLYLKLYNHKE